MRKKKAKNLVSENAYCIEFVTDLTKQSEVKKRKTNEELQKYID